MSDDEYDYEVDDYYFSQEISDESTEDGYYYSEDDRSGDSSEEETTQDELDTNKFYGQQQPINPDGDLYKPDVLAQDITEEERDFYEYWSDENENTGQDHRNPVDDWDEDSDEVIAYEADLKNPSKPSGYWSETELEQGFLTSHSPYAPDVPPPQVSDKAAFIDSVTEYLEWQKSSLSSNQTPYWESADFRELLHNWAINVNHVRGKWMLFAPPQVVDSLWADICRANESGMLGGYCKVYPLNAETNSYFIAVFCNDFNHVEDCKRVLRGLHNICVSYRVPISNFKPDFLTDLGVYKERSSAVHCKFTHAELGIVDAWVQPDLKEILDDLNGNSNERKTRRNKRRKRPKRMEETYNGPYSNDYATGIFSDPSRPNGRWSEEEERNSFLWSFGQWPPQVADVEVRDIEGFDSTAEYLLDDYEYRLRTAYVTEDEKRSLFRRLYELAGQHDFVCGKWKVFAHPSVADELWEAICHANDAGELGGRAKISAFNSRSGKFLICVYCNDFRNTEDCKRVLYNLHAICSRFEVPIIANFKADFLSHLGVYTVKGNGLQSRYPLNELRLTKHWPNEALKEILDDLKQEVHLSR